MFSESDKVMFKRMMLIINSGEFSFKGEAVEHAALLFRWFRELEPKINAAIKPQEKPTPKIVKEPIKKVK
jgi:hypothetical protein